MCSENWSNAENFQMRYMYWKTEHDDIIISFLSWINSPYRMQSIKHILYGKYIYLVLAYSPSNGTLFFGNNIKSKMGILNLIWKIYFNQKTLIKNIFLKFVYVFINAVIRWTFNILNVLMQITFPSCTLSDMDQWLSVEHKAMLF